jgi:hypothetical protein
LTRGFHRPSGRWRVARCDHVEIFPEPVRRTIVGALPRLAPASFCREAVRPQHLDPAAQALASLTERQKTAVADVDRMRNVESRMVRCVADGQTVTFDKETGSAPGGPRQRIYGAIRFLDGGYSTFQIIRGGPDAPIRPRRTTDGARQLVEAAALSGTGIVRRRASGAIVTTALLLAGCREPRSSDTGQPKSAWSCAPITDSLQALSR